MVRNRVAVGLACALLLLVPVDAGSRPTNIARIAFEEYRTTLERALTRGDPELRRFYEYLQTADDRFRIDWHRSIHDLTGDGAEEILVERLRFTIDEVTFSFTGDYRARLLNGRTGRFLWDYENEYEGGFPVLAMTMRVGRGVPGLLFPKVDMQSAESPTYRLSLAAADARGKLRWERTFTSSYNLATGDVAGTDAPVAFERFDPDGDAPSDFLIGLTDYVKAAVPDRAVARSDLLILDGRDGELREMGTVGPDTYWFHSIQAGPNIDGTPGEDIVIAGEENSPDSYLETRSGLSGDTIWRRSTHLGWYPWAHRMPDMNGDGNDDMIVGWDRPQSNERVFQIWDAREGRSLWKAEGTFPYLLGDADNDSITDIGAFQFVHTRKRSGARFLAYSKGHQLYRRSYVRRLPTCDGFCFTLGFYLDAGDLDGDRLRDTYVLTSYPTKRKPKIVEYTVSGRDARVLFEQRHVAPVLGSIDGNVGDDLVGSTRSEKGIVRVTAYEGVGRRILWSRAFRMKGARNLGPYGAYDAAAELDGDGGTELVVTVTAPDAVTLLALEGATGNILWQRPIRGNRHITVQR